MYVRFPICFVQVHVLTADHDCNNLAEVNMVKKRSSDPNAIRPSHPSSNVMRVAGSLAVTRALGDGFLKIPALSFSPYRCVCCHDVIVNADKNLESGKKIVRSCFFYVYVLLRY